VCHNSSQSPPTEAVLSLNQSEYSVSEVDGQLLVNVTLSSVASQNVTVLFTITDGTTTGNIVNPMPPKQPSYKKKMFATL